MNFKSLFDILDYFKDEKTGIEYCEQMRWNGNPTCPHCGSEKPYKTNRGWKCSNKECHKKFTVKVGTIFENSKVSFRIWFAAIYLVTTSKKGISSVQLASQLNITQKTAWFVLHRIREMLKEKSPAMLGENNPVEIDETYVGGKEKNKHYLKKRSEEDKNKTNEGNEYVPKKTVIGIIERDGKVVLKHIDGATKESLQNAIEDSVLDGSKIYTDEYVGYRSLSAKYDHDTVNHSLSIYVDGDIHTNTLENFWSILKRGIYGIYHFVSSKHLERYLHEFGSRHNNRLQPNAVSFKDYVQNMEGYLSYKRLTK